MRILPADHRERRGESVLFVWGDAPFWIVVDPEAARFRAVLVLVRGGRAEDAAGHLARAIALDPYRASNRTLLAAVKEARER